MAYKNKREDPSGRPLMIELEGRSFNFVTMRRGDQLAIYKGDGEFARIGQPKSIFADVSFHKQMLKSGFPVAPIITEGEKDGQAYFIEKSLGERHFGDIFTDEFQVNGKISDTSFESFLSIVERFARAQLTTESKLKDADEFAQGIHLDEVCDEFPELADRLRARYRIAEKKTTSLPFVMTHGDFNPHNIYPLGVIDFEHAHHGPYGYDLVSAIMHIDYFPDSKAYEYSAGYRFTSSQKKKYFERLNAISQGAKLTPLSQYEDDFYFCRAIWMLAKLAHVPLLQKFRYDAIVQKFFKN